MQKVRILDSDYITFDPAIGEIVNARRDGTGWAICVSESFKFCESNARIWRGDEDTELFFSSNEVEVIEVPFAYWNALKSSRAVGALPQQGVNYE